MAGLIVRYEGGVGIAGRRFALSAWLRMADLCGFGRFEGEGRGSARLKLGLSSESKPLSAHRFFTRQVAGAERQGAAKRWEEGGVGKGGVGTCGYGWAPQ